MITQEEFDKAMAETFRGARMILERECMNTKGAIIEALCETWEAFMQILSRLTLGFRHIPFGIQDRGEIELVSVQAQRMVSDWKITSQWSK